MKIDILTTYEKHPINPYLHQFKYDLVKKHSVTILRSAKEARGGDLLFLISCNEKVSGQVLNNFKHSMVIHASDLPRGRGWSPHVWEIISGAGQITLSLLDAASEVDGGDIYKKVSIEIPRSALWNEINNLLFSAEIELMKFAIENFDNLEKTPQSGSFEATYYKKRSPADSKIDANKSISEQFNLIRVCDPNRFPAFFEFEGITYKLVLEKV